ncbi:Hypothetical protein D9617_21g097320 [Elsinoe fawcettii]|nr:Hypothetical protein D9617_21g097320 [Elsinoe fawcettii]
MSRQGPSPPPRSDVWAPTVYNNFRSMPLEQFTLWLHTSLRAAAHASIGHPMGPSNLWDADLLAREMEIKFWNSFIRAGWS